ncbi:MAG: hypothetical protein GF364_11450, partial [Candidatus Lokiarchaeota archaeon]|nr:hypothetical protein [Candidatus Lokiarchaeota archaeon]
MLLVATEAKGTKENAHLLNASKKLGISCIIFSLDDLEINLKVQEESGYAVFRIQNILKYYFNEYFQKEIKKERLIQYKDSILTFSPQELVLNWNVKVLIRRLGAAIPIQKKDPEIVIKQKLRNTSKNQGSFIQKFLKRLSKIEYLEKAGFNVINSSKSIEKSMDKLFTTYNIMQEINKTPLLIVKTINTHLITGFNRFLELFDTYNGDVVLKPQFGGHGLGILRINRNNFHEIRDKIEKILLNEGNLFLQPFI